MKRKWIISLTLALLLSPSLSLQAQSLMDRMAKKAAEKLEQKTEERIEQKIDEGIERGLDATEDAVKEGAASDTPPAASRETAEQREAQQQIRMQNMLSKMSVSGEPVRFSDTYTFDAFAGIHNNTLKLNGEVVSVRDMISYFEASHIRSDIECVSGNLEMKDGTKNKRLFIIDQDNKTTLILSNENNEKAGIAYGMSGLEHLTYEEDSYDEEEADGQHPNLQKTGRTKTIAGYPCEEYTYANEESKGTVWLTTSIKNQQSRALSNQFGWNQVFLGSTKGYLMASESTDLETGETSIMEITEINTTRKTTFNTREYSITNLGNMQLGGE